LKESPCEEDDAMMTNFSELNFYQTFCVAQIIFFKKCTVLLKQCHNQVINSLSK